MSTAEQVEQLLAAKQGAEGALERLRTERYRELGNQQQVCDSCLSDPCRCVGLPPLEPR